MNKNGSKGTRYAIHWETHSKNLMKNFCSLMEHQSLVDIVICCGNNTIQAHKFVLAANSPLFRDEFEKNPSIEQIQIGGCEFSVLKSVVEIMYCGQTVVTQDDVKVLIAIIKLFQMKNLENLFSEHANSSEEILLPKPQFLTKKPKYPAFTYQIPPVTSQNATTCIVTSNANSSQCNVVNNPQAAAAAVAMAAHNANSVLKPMNFNITLPESIVAFKPYGRGRKTLKQQAEQACVKEAQASRMALASLQKEIAAAPQVTSFIIEDTCTETTVENFIPHNDAEQSPYIQVINYNDVITENGIHNSMFLPVGMTQNSVNHQSPYSSNMGQKEKRCLTADKLKYMLGGEMPSNVEIMYKDADGNFVPVNEEVLQNLSTKEGLQYQVVDEDGCVSEMQELHVIDKIEKMDQMDHTPSQDPILTDDIVTVTKPALEVGDYLKETGSVLSVKEGMCSIISNCGEETPIPTPTDVSQPTMDMPYLEANKPGVRTDIDLKFSPDIFFADIMSSDIQSDVTIIEESMFAKCEAVHKIEKMEEK